MYRELWIFLILLVSSISINAQTKYLESNYPASVLEDAVLDTSQLIKKYKYPVETHFVTTADKYILCLHRLPRPDGLPVFMMHGMLDSSATWVTMGPWSGLGYFLYDLGYDVWMGNARGNRYSRNHTDLNPSVDKSYWNFSFNEVGYYDLPAMIDYVLRKTNKTKLTYIGHSQGTTSFFVMCSKRPDYNDKISSMHALAPVAFMKNIKSPLVSLVENLVRISGDIFPEILPHSEFYLKYVMASKASFETFLDYIWQIMGKETKQANATMWPVIVGHTPAGGSIKQLKHYIQLTKKNHFCQFDLGLAENMKRYGRATPPDYRLKRIRAPVGLYYAYNDFLTSEVDVQNLARILPNVVENNLFPYKKWNHVTFIWGIEARELVHKRVLDVIRKFE